LIHFKLNYQLKVKLTRIGYQGIVDEAIDTSPHKPFQRSLLTTES
jgi:hypothetical protein